MDILINVVGQQLKTVTNLKSVVSGTQNFIRFKFNFNSDWDGLGKIAQFIQGEELVQQDNLDVDNSVYLPSAVKPGNCIVVLYGTDGNTVRATTDYLNISITKDMIVDDASVIQMTESVFDYIARAVQGISITQSELEQIIQADVQNVLDNYREQGILADLTIEDGTIGREKVDADFEATLAKADSAMQQINPNSVEYSMLSSDLQTAIDTIDHLDMAIPDESLSRIKMDSDIQEALSKADTAIQSASDITNGTISRSKVDSDFEATLLKADTAMQSIGNGTITRSMMNQSLESTLALADSAMQESVYNPNHIATDPYSYSDGKAVVVNELPVTGTTGVDYYIANASGLYEHYRWIGNDYQMIGTSASTIVVEELPQNPNPDFDYILVNNGEYQYYKYIDDEWAMISGGSGEVIQRNYTISAFGHGVPEGNLGWNYLDLDTLIVYILNIIQEEDTVTGEVISTTYEWSVHDTLVPSPSETKDYYCQFGSDSGVLHFKYIGNKFVLIGDLIENNQEFKNLQTAVSGMQSAVTTNTANISRNAGDIATNATNLTSLSHTVDSIIDDLSNLDVEGYTYEAELDQAEDTSGNERYRYTLYETKDNVTTVKSQFFLPEGGGGGGGSATSIMTVEKITQSPIIATVSDDIIIEINYSSTDGETETYDGTYVWKNDGRTVLSGSLIQGRNTFDLTNYCSPGTQKLTLTVTDETGNVSVKSWTVQVVNVRIETTFNDRFTQQIGKSVNFTYTPYGAISKTVHFSLDGVELDTFTTSASSTLQSYTIAAQPHGSHLLEVWITASINNTNIETNHIYKDIIWYDETEDDAVIGCIYRYDHYGRVTARQYDTTQIVYNVFDPTTNYPVVKRYVDNVLISTEALETSQAVWNYKSDTIGEHTLRIECRDTVVTIVMNITELGIDIDPITGGLEIDFNPTGITNNSSNRIWENENYHMTVSNNFDWANGGYQTDENGDTYFLIKAGTTASFDYEMFAGNPTNNVSSTGAEMKIVFMTENVQDADAVWLSNVETINTVVDNTTVTTNMGIQMGVHNGWLKTNKASTSDVEVGEGESADTVAATNTYLYMPYSEEDIIEMDINIDILDTESETAQAFVMAYEDGVPSKAYIYDGTDRFYQYTPQPITIGSTYCDVRIYRLKIYSTTLTTEGIMKNFIADSRDSTTMLERYDRNSIYYDREHQEYTPYSGQGVLDPERLAQIIPNVKVLMLETDHFTTSKKTFVKSSLRCIHAPGGDLYPGDPYYDNWLFENGYHSGQGTTSDNYGNSGRNVDFLFNCDGVHKPSDKVDAEAGYVSQVTLGYNTENAHTEVCDDWKGDDGKVTLTRSSIPNNFFNLKVNIASSENANNALMQKRYSDFLPYISPAKQRDERIKNDMEFVPAVLFLKETNPDPSTHNEFLDNEWHFYALGNLGDSKKTDYTRAYYPDDMNEFTIEISDNTKNNATFQTGVYDTGNGVLNYEHFHLVKTLDKDGKLVVTPVSDTTISSHVYPVPAAQADTLLFQTGTIIVDNQTGDAQYDGNETGYLNMRIWCLYNEAFDGDHSFEPRYACCGDYRDGKLVNDYSGHGKQQVKTNEKVWRAFYKWVITSTDEQFVNELDQWCVRNAVEFFYAFTLYYTMMDNRAKNTFWHYAKTGIYREVSRPVPELLHIYEELDNDEYVPTEDVEIDPNKTYYTQYAFDQWNYDDDTSIGINNNGELVFPYGKEDTDFNIENDASSGYVFNGATSVFWCRLRDLLSSQITEIFNSVQAECFSATNLITQFDNFQACYPEEIWRLDVERKYIRTFTGNTVDNSKPKQDTQYLRDMMQGRKKYQRRQWVRDQEIYFGTKYLMNAVVGDHNRITFRCYDPGANAVVPADYSISITPFQDMYVSAMFGNGDQRQVRAKANETVVLNFSVSTTTDTQVTIYGANRIAALNDLSACYIAANNFSMATKLRKLVLGNTTPGYSNPRLISLTLGSNKLLEELDLRNCSNLTGALNLTQCSNLLKLYAEGTRITGATFATNGKVQIIHLPNTINTLVMRNLNNLADFQCDLDYLEQLTLQGGTLNNYALVSDTIDTLQVAYLYDVDWTVPDTTVLNALVNAYYSLLTGSVYIDGTSRLNEIATYNAKWADLEVTYNPNYLVEQYVATYVNDDGTQLCQVYVDRGTAPPDPVEMGLIDTPTKASDAQYSYIYDGWDDITSIMTGARTITATYTSTIRTYTVTWYSRPTLPLATTQAEYGTEVVYPNDIPTRTEDEDSLRYYVFTGWDKSTGFITGDIDVYAIWDDKYLPSVGEKELSQMSVAEIYGLGQAANRTTNPINLDSYLDSKDYIDIQIGNDFNFSNVESELLLSERWFDGNSYYDTGITLFDEDSPSFTLAVDYEFYNTTTNSTLMACYDENGNEGLRLRYSTSPQLQWGDKSAFVGSETGHGLFVVRHLAGSDKISVYVTNTQQGVYDDSISTYELTRSRSTSTDMTLIFGAIKFVAQDGIGYDNYATGWIHWAKIWYEDLGQANAQELAAWTHETWRAEYFSGSNRYRITNSYRYAKLPFILNNMLPSAHIMNNSSVNSGGFAASSLNTFVNNRVLKALPIGWRSIIKSVRVGSSAGNQSTEILYTDNKIFIPAYAEISNILQEPYSSEGTLIDWYGTQDARYKFAGLIVPSNSRRFSQSEDPTANSGNNIVEGDLWYNTRDGAEYYYIPKSVSDRHHYNGQYSNITAYDEGLWVHSVEWWTRSPHANYNEYFVIVSSGGYAGWLGSPNTYYYIDVMFAV